MPLKPNEKRAAKAILIIRIILAIHFVSLISGYFEYNLLNRLLNGTELTPIEIHLNILRQYVIYIIYAVAHVISIVFFIQWFRRAYYNLHQKIHYLNYKEGWAAGSWFIPIINLYRPYLIMRELFLETEEFLHKRNVPSIGKPRQTGYIWWWPCWLLTLFISNTIFQLSLEAKAIDLIIKLSLAEMGNTVLRMILCLITVRMIKEYASLERQLASLDKEETAGKNPDTPYFAEGLLNGVAEKESQVAERQNHSTGP